MSRRHREIIEDLLNISFVPKRKNPTGGRHWAAGARKAARGVSRQVTSSSFNDDDNRCHFSTATFHRKISNQFSYEETFQLSFWFHRFNSTANSNASRTSPLLEKEARSTHQALCNFFQHTHTETHTNALSQQAAIWTQREEVRRLCVCWASFQSHTDPHILPENIYLGAFFLPPLSK